MLINERLNTVKRLRWILRQRSRISKLLGFSNAASMHCPYCKSKVYVGDFFCCSDLERAWEMTEKPASAPVLAENHS
jgi:hypothetical protein